jgi:hypothetical protein
MATSNNKSVSVAQAAYNAQTPEEFIAWLDSNPQTEDVKDDSGKVVGQQPKVDKAGQPVRRVASASANYTGDSEATFWGVLHHPVVASKGRYDDGTLSYITRYGLALVNAEREGTLKVPKDVQQAIVSELDAALEAQKKAQAERMSGLGAGAAADYKAAKAKAEQLDKVMALLTDEQKAALGLS